MRPCRPHGRRDATCGVDVVVLQHDRRGQVVAMVGTAAHAHSLLLEDAHVRARLARVHELGARTRERTCHATRERGDTAHALQVVERHPFAGEQHAGVAGNVGEHLAGGHLVAVFHQTLDARGGIEQLEGALEDVEPRNDARRLGDELNRRRSRLGADRDGRNVLVGDILAQRRPDQVVRHELHGNGIHNLSFRALRPDGQGRRTWQQARTVRPVSRRATYLSRQGDRWRQPAPPWNGVGHRARARPPSPRRAGRRMR